MPIYKIHELPKPEEEYDESHPLCTRVVHWNMLFLLAWTETDIKENIDDDSRLPDHQACTPQDQAVTKKTSPIKMLVYSLWGMFVKMSHSILGCGDSSFLVGAWPPKPSSRGKGQEPVKHIYEDTSCVKKNFGRMEVCH